MTTTTTPRRGLVLGGGGVLGGTWAVAALVALERTLDIDVRDCELIVGTSAGSVLASLLGSGVTPAQLHQHYSGEPVSDGPLAGLAFDLDTAAGGHRPGIPKGLGPGSFELIGTTLRHPRRLPPTAVLSAFLPAGARSLDRIGHLVDAVVPFGHWCDHPGVWIVAMDYADGSRVVFGRDDAPTAPMSRAVMASCAIPGWFAPVHIGDRTYVDGGTISATSVDILADRGLDEVYVIAPMVSFHTDRPDSITGRLERRWRHEVTKQCIAEAELVRHSGTAVHILGPGPEDLAAIGANLMDATKRRHVLETSLRTSTEGWRHLLATAASA